MTRHVCLILALALLSASTPLDAQVGGLLRKKAGEVLGKKPEPAKPAPRRRGVHRCGVEARESVAGGVVGLIPSGERSRSG